MAGKSVPSGIGGSMGSKAKTAAPKTIKAAPVKGTRATGGAKPSAKGMPAAKGTKPGKPTARGTK